MEEAQDALQDYRLTTAEILYRMPEYPNLLQSYLWQSLDRVPDFPKLNEFLGFWESKLDGKLHSVRVATLPVIQAPAMRNGGLYLTLH